MTDAGFEKGSAGVQQSGGDSAGLEKGNEAPKAPCFLCGEARGSASPCPHCGVAELE